ncbi:MAG: AAA family ATPase [Actinobacteria bacterium]|nr:AAA family ATPase [Actinomycetota bacterium]
MNPQIARYCLACGVPIEPAAGRPAEERKTVTVLFCDLVGFTAASDRADPEDVRARIRPYHARLRGEVETFGGTVEKFIGDAVMAVFGAPVTHEDDPERAVRAGLRILEAIADLNHEDAELSLAVRVGVESGEAVVALGARPARGEGLIAGDVVNTASRLQGAAPVGGVLVGPGTYSATRQVFDYQALAPVVLKGKAGPTAVFQALAPRARFGTELTRSLGTPMVGRQIDLGIVTGAFQKAVQEATVQLALVAGEPGVGKSRLVAELRSFVDSWPGQIRWRLGRCLPYGDGITFWALSEIVKAEAGILETDAPEVAGAKIDATIPEYAPDAPWLRARLRPLAGLPAPEAALAENFAAWRAFVELLAETHPTVLVFEDLHWADEALLEFVEQLADYAAGVPLLIVGTARPELYERAAGWAASARNVTRVNLRMLTAAETARLVSNLLGTAKPPAEVQQAIWDHAGGNPLYAEEFIGLLKDQQILRRAGDRWDIDTSAAIPLPPGVHGLIAARLDILGSARKRMLQDAAVVGQVFWADAVAEIGDQDQDQVQAALHELVRRELIHPARRSSMAGQAEYFFTHALIRDVCYAQIPRADRAQRHRRAAAWIERVAGERAADHAEILAAHCTTALELAQAVRDPQTGELAASAARYLMLAGDRAMGIHVAAGERHYARALAMTGSDHPDRAELLARYGEALRLRARFCEAAAAFEQAIAAFQADGNVRRAAMTTSRYSMLLHRLGDHGYPDAADRALGILEPLGPSPELAEALAGRAAASFLSDQHEEAAALAERAVELAAELGLPVPARALGFRGSARFALGRAAGLADMRRALEAATAQGLGRETAVLYHNLAVSLGRAEGPRAAWELAQQGITFAQRHGIAEWEPLLESTAVEALADLGLIEQAQTLIATALARVAADDWMGQVDLRSAEARIVARRGELRQSGLMDWIQRAVAKARELGEPQYLGGLLALAAITLPAAGEARDAIPLLAELAHIPNVRHTLEYLRSLPDLVRVAIAAGNADLGRQLMNGLKPVFQLDHHAAVTARALLAEQTGNHAEAAALFTDAAGRWGQFEVQWEHGHALLGQGRCLLRLGQPAEAREPLDAARDLFASLGAKPVLGDANRLLAETAALAGS